MRSSFVAALLLTCASLGRVVHGGAVCEQLRVPPASLVHELVVIDQFERAHENARALCASRHVPTYKCDGVVQQILDALADMGAHAASDAIVNITFDHTLAYEVHPGPLDQNDTDASSTKAQHGEQRNTKELFVVAPEKPLDETVADYCVRNGMPDAGCQQLHDGLNGLVARDWGCLDNTRTSSETADAQVSAALPDAADLVDPASSQLSETAAETESVDFTATLSGGSPHTFTVRVGDDIELLTALQCRAWRIDASACVQLFRHVLASLESRPAFTAASARATRLEISSPGRLDLYPTSERIYLDAEWVDTASAPSAVCIFSNHQPTPIHCGPVPPPDQLFIPAHGITSGAQLLLFAEPSPQQDAENALEPIFFAARLFLAVEAEVELLKVEPRMFEGHAFLNLRVRTRAFNLFGARNRMCALVDDTLECFNASQLEIHSDDGVGEQRELTFDAPVFEAIHGTYNVTLLLMNEYNKCFAMSAPHAFTVHAKAHVAELPRQPQFLLEPPGIAHVRRPSRCPPQLQASVSLHWLCSLWRHEWGRYSQNGEDGVLLAIFRRVGATSRQYVEFGTEDARQCNTRLLREVHGWTGLLMDGSHSNASINLQREWITAENINALFVKHGVAREFDLLSVDIDFNDYWVLRALDRSRFSPRVIVIEVNAHIPPSEARTVRRDDRGGWDGTTDYFGVSVAAVDRWARASGYTLVYCESRGVNCFLIRNDVLAGSGTADADAEADVEPETAAALVRDTLRVEDLQAQPNFFGRGIRYPSPPESFEQHWVWLDDQ